MASRRISGANGDKDGADAVGHAFQLLAQGLAQLQEALLLQKQEAERKVQEAEERMQEALRMQGERAAETLREIERKLQDKADAITALQYRFQEAQKRGMAVEGSEGGGWLRLECRMNEVDASLQSALQTFLPRVEALLRQLEEPEGTRASLATAAATAAASAREAPATEGAAAGSEEEPPSSTPTPTPSSVGHQGAAADEEERAWQRVELRVREVEMKMEVARTSPSPLGEQLCCEAYGGRLSKVRHLIDSGADVNYIDKYGSTPLINAAYSAHADVVSVLLQRGADANAPYWTGSSALHFAVWKDRSGRCVERTS